MRVTCEACGKVHVAEGRLAGRAFRMQCKRCGSVITVGPAAAVPLPAPPSARADGADGADAASAGIAGEAPVFTFGDEAPGRPPAAPGTAAPAGPPPFATDADDAFADFSRELQEFCDDLEREGPGASPGDRAAPASAVPGRSPAADTTPPAADTAPSSVDTAPRADAAPSAAGTAPSAAAASEPGRRRNLAPVVALVATAIGVAAWLVARQPGGTAAPSPPIAGGAPAAAERQAAVDRPASSSPAPPLPASPAPAAAPAPAPAPAPAAVPSVPAADAAVAQEVVPPAAPASRPQAPPAARGPRNERAPAPRIAPAASPATSPAAAVPSAPPDPPGGAVREATSPSRPDLPPRDSRAAQAQLAGLASAFDECVADARRSDPELFRGPRSVVLTLTVRPSGRTAYPTLDDAQLSGTPLGACIKGRAAALVFPEAGGEPVRVRLQLELGD